MKRRFRKNEEELNFWQPTTDLMSGLMYVLMLVIVLLGLYLIQIPDSHDIDPYIGNDVEGGDYPGDYPTPSPTHNWGYHYGGAGGGVTPAPTWPMFTGNPTYSPSPSPTISPTPDLPGTGGGSGGGTGGGGSDGDGPGRETDVGMKSAVYVMMIDAETDRTIKEEGVEFELYGLGGALQVLNTYYPEKVTYRSYLTSPSGTFYFPEKLMEGVYQVHELTEPEGYDASGNVTFWLLETYDWPDPLVVRVPLMPSKNIVRIQMTDVETGKSIPGGSFDVIADENIFTADGTLRYRQGQTVATIECDETGYGESEEIYLGNYKLRQHDIPDFYASYPDEIPVEIEKKSAVLPPINVVENTRSKINLFVGDELYPTRGVQGAVLNVRAAGITPFTVTTDYSGKVTLDSLEKGVTYRIAQTRSSEQYRIDPAEYSLTVTSMGRINGEPEADVTLTNRLIRAAIGLTDELSNIQIPGVNLSLYTETGDLIRTWTTSGIAQSFNGLAPGNYSVRVGGDDAKNYSIMVRDTAEVQNLDIHTSYTFHYILYGSIGFALLVLIVIILLLVRRRSRRRR